jgi:hypothetical protein
LQIVVKLRSHISGNMAVGTLIDGFVAEKVGAKNGFFQGWQAGVTAGLPDGVEDAPSNLKGTAFGGTRPSPIKTTSKHRTAAQTTGNEGPRPTINKHWTQV